MANYDTKKVGAQSILVLTVKSQATVTQWLGLFWLENGMPYTGISSDIMYMIIFQRGTQQENSSTKHAII